MRSALNVATVYARNKVCVVTGKQSALVDTRVVYCGDNLEQLKKLPDGCRPPFNSHRNYGVVWGETKEKRAFEDRHAITQAYIEFMRLRCPASPSSNASP